MQNFHFFYNGYFSNWHYCDFIIDNIKYNCAEQYMMYQKAMYFKDIETANKIIKCQSPKKQKAFGRQVKNFNQLAWDKVKYNLVKNGIRQKFMQNKYLKDYLLLYKNRILVEASPYDRIWGIGFNEDNAIANIKNWGENLLGKILTELCNEIK